ncbi:MAG: hypothetical protein CR993_02080 [Rhodobacterales bacterium]|nr:MAG: hypothetical protein CR993_02080 [Rhodobacterales bacterium]
MVSLLLFLPLATAVFVGLGHRVTGARGAEISAVVSAIFTALWAWLVLLALGDAPHQEVLGHWMDVGEGALEFSLQIQRVNAVPIALATSLSALLQLYALAYLAQETSFGKEVFRPRFFALMQFATFAFILFAAAGDLAMLFFGYQALAFAAMFLIGFRYSRPTAGKAALRAFMFWQVGALALLLMATLIGGKLDADGVVFLLENRPVPLLGPIGSVLAVMAFAGLLPMQGWVSGTAETPLPAATLLGVLVIGGAGLLLWHLLPVFTALPELGLLVFWIAAASGVYALSVAVVQLDVLRAGVWLMVAQASLGAMLFAVASGLRDFIVPFHFWTSGSGWALLLLGLGAAAFVAGGERDLRRIGSGFRHHVPSLFWPVLIGGVALSSVGGLSILGLLRAGGGWSEVLAFGLLNFANSFAVWRLIFRVFFGRAALAKPTVALPRRLALPLLPLALAALVAMFSLTALLLASGGVGLLELSPVLASAAGILGAWLFYRTRPNLPKSLAHDWPQTNRFLRDGWRLDGLYSALFATPVHGLANAVLRLADGGALAGANRTFAALPGFVTRRAARWQARGRAGLVFFVAGAIFVLLIYLGGRAVMGVFYG